MFLSRAQVKWSLDNSIEDLLSSLQEKVCMVTSTTNVHSLSHNWSIDLLTQKCHLVPCVGSECSEAPGRENQRGWGGGLQICHGGSCYCVGNAASGG